MAKDKTESGIVIDISKWRTGDAEDWQEVAIEGKLSKMRAFLIEKEAIKDWPFEGDPGNAEDWRNLPLEESMSVYREVGQALSNIFRSMAG